MRTLRQAFQARIDTLQARIAGINTDAAARIAPLAAEIDTLQQKTVKLTPWLDMTAADARQAIIDDTTVSA